MTSDSSGDIDSATQAARAAVDAADLRTPDLPWIAERPPRRHADTLVACAAALALHGGVAAALWFGIPYDPEDIGGNGLGRDAIGIDIIDNQVLAALSYTTLALVTMGTVGVVAGVAESGWHPLTSLSTRGGR